MEALLASGVQGQAPEHRITHETISRLRLSRVFQPLDFGKMLCYGTRRSQEERVSDTAPEVDKFLDVQDCARILRMSARFIYEKLRAGQGPRHKRFGNRYRIRHSELMKWASGPNKRKN